VNTPTDFAAALAWGLEAKARGEVHDAAHHVRAAWGPAAGLGLAELLSRPATTSAVCVDAAIVLHAAGCFDLAVVACERAVLLDPDSTIAWPALAWLLPAVGRTAALPDLYRRWAEARPGDATARHMHAATTGRELARASEAYVRELFDEFARTFDETLTRLDYRVPAAIEQALASAWPTLPAAPRALDLGCGTGLVGDRLRPHVARLVGVDLSEAMLAMARDRGVYDELVCADMIAATGAMHCEYDVVVAGDALVYLGELAPVAGAIAGALRPGGLVVATTERNPEGAPHRLMPSGRFAHAADALPRALAGAGLVIVANDALVLRREGGSDVDGRLTLARRP
jgi:predicted TPR repeat methyltransferase